MRQPDRRDVMKGLGAGALALGACKPESESEDTGQMADPRTPEADSPFVGSGLPDTGFKSGVQSGDPTPDTLTLWTRYTGDGEVEVEVYLWDGSAWTELAREAVTVAEGGYVHHELTGLPSDSLVGFQFTDGSGASAPGVARTAIEPEHTGVVRFGACSCLDQSRANYPSLANARALGPMDAMIWLGDTVYQDGNFSVERFRDLWLRQFRKDSFRDHLSQVPGVFTWDDHEVGNNWNPETVSPELLENATTAFFESLPIRQDPANPTRIWRSLRFGQAVELFVLDCRAERQPSRELYLSTEQMEWLTAGLRASTATWKVIANSVPITNMPDAWETVAGDDSWFSYQAQRTELLDTCEEVGGAFFLTGDFHHCTFARVEPDGEKYSGIFEAFCGPGGSFLNVLAKLIENEDQFLFSDAEWSTAYLEFNVDGTARCRMVDDANNLMLDTTVNTAGEVLDMNIFHPNPA